MNENEKLELSPEQLKDAVGGSQAAVTNVLGALMEALDQDSSAEGKAKARADALFLADSLFKNGFLIQAEYEGVLSTIDRYTL